GVNSRGIEHYSLHDEKVIPQNSLPNLPLIGMFVVKNDNLQDPALYFYNLYLIYADGNMYCYEIRRKEQTNDL
ncbi:6361_t:CDS:2, partial [Scutellospora calospora]